MKSEYKTFNIILENEPLEWVRIREDKDPTGYIHGHYAEFAHITARGIVRAKLEITNNNDMTLDKWNAKLILENGVEIPMYVTGFNMGYR